MLQNKVILVTGAGGGIGGSAALALAGQGATVVLLDKNIPKLEAVYDRIQAANSPTPIMYPFDLAGATEMEYQELADRIEEKYGLLDGLLHTAAEFTGFMPFGSLTTKNWGHTLNVNLNAPFLLTQVLLPLLTKSGSASIVFTSDSSVRNATAYSGVYGVSKIAVEGLAKILAEELESSKKIRVNTVIPGPVNSPLRNRAFPGEDKNKLPSAASIADVFTYLFSPQSLAIHGQTIDAQTFSQ